MLHVQGKTPNHRILLDLRFKKKRKKPTPSPALLHADQNSRDLLLKSIFSKSAIPQFCKEFVHHPWTLFTCFYIFLSGIKFSPTVFPQQHASKQDSKTDQSSSHVTVFQYLVCKEIWRNDCLKDCNYYITHHFKASGYTRKHLRGVCDKYHSRTCKSVHVFREAGIFRRKKGQQRQIPLSFQLRIQLIASDWNFVISTK